MDWKAGSVPTDWKAVDPERFRRMTSATRIKDWDGLGQDFDDIVLKVDAKDPITGFQLRFARAFGRLRVQEILMLGQSLL